MPYYRNKTLLLYIRLVFITYVWIDLDVTTIGLERNAIRNHVIHVVPNMVNVRTELACVVKDGTEDIVLCVSLYHSTSEFLFYFHRQTQYKFVYHVSLQLDARMVAPDTDCARCKTASTVANARPVGLAETVAYDLRWNVMILSTMIRVSFLIVQSEHKKKKRKRRTRKKKLGLIVPWS